MNSENHNHQNKIFDYLSRNSTLLHDFQLTIFKNLINYNVVIVNKIKETDGKKNFIEAIGEYRIFLHLNRGEAEIPSGPKRWTSDNESKASTTSSCEKHNFYGKIENS